MPNILNSVYYSASCNYSFVAMSVLQILNIGSVKVVELFQRRRRCNPHCWSSISCPIAIAPAPTMRTLLTSFSRQCFWSRLIWRKSPSCEYSWIYGLKMRPPQKKQNVWYSFIISIPSNFRHTFLILFFHLFIAFNFYFIYGFPTGYVLTPRCRNYVWCLFSYSH